MTDSTFKHIAIAQLESNPFQPRDKIKKEDILELAQSIKVHGVLEPLVVAHTPAGYQIIAGERRWRAAKEAGLLEVPAYIKKTTPREMLEMALVENVQRQDLNAIERAQAFQRLSQEFGLTVSQLADRVAKSSSYISNSLKLLRLPAALTDGLIGGQISEGHARALLGAADDKSMIELYKQILREGASVRRAEDLVRLHRRMLDKPIVVGRPLTFSDEQVKAWESQLQQQTRVPVALKLLRSRNHTRITVTLKGTPEQTQRDLEKIMTIAKGK